MKHIQLIIVALLLTVVSGCFPVFVPVGGGNHGGHGGGGHEHGDRGRD